MGASVALSISIEHGSAVARTVASRGLARQQADLAEGRARLENRDALALARRRRGRRRRRVPPAIRNMDAPRLSLADDGLARGEAQQAGAGRELRALLAREGREELAAPRARRGPRREAVRPRERPRRVLVLPDQRVGDREPLALQAVPDPLADVASRSPWKRA